MTEIDDISRARHVLTTRKPAVCVFISDGPSGDILNLLGFIREQKLRTKVIVNVASGSVNDAVDMMRAGADDYMICDRTGERLIESILKSATHYSQNTTDLAVQPHSGVRNTPQAILVGQSPSICEIRSAISLVARSLTTVLVTGESGTGKEVVAKLIQSESVRNHAPYIAVNCAAIPQDVIENELFGHEKGAFTGAITKKDGIFELANGGTIFLDEIAEMSVDTQAKLLRAIETQKYRRLGGREEVNVDVRIIAATNKDIDGAIKGNKLREDLYYRLSVIEIHLPPVRERTEDIPLLVDYFFKVFSSAYRKPVQKFSDDAMDELMRYSWPGNIREIRNTVERATVVCPHEVINPSYLPERIFQKTRPGGLIHIPIGSTSHEVEKKLILETLASAGYNKAKTAKILGMSRKTLHNKLSSYHRMEGAKIPPDLLTTGSSTPSGTRN